ncbi:MAG: RsmD family RNA methyltransferase [Phycisphaerales bacterium]|nr:RsmD family RNA methyltransferase [Phycisphaerales bacterium]
MRIIAGRYRSRKLLSPPDRSPTRPLPDRVRESIFSLLRGHFDDAVVLDGFAGVGTFGLEAASRGASRVIMVERDRRVAGVLQQNVDALKAGDVVEVVIGDALGPACLARCPTPIKIAFLDPPYELVRTVEGWERVRGQMARIVALLSDDGYAMVRTPWPFIRREEAETPTRDTRRDNKDEGDGADLVITDLDDQDEGAVDERAAELHGPRRPRPVDVDLSIAGAEGPETHVYKSTAVHLYMRRRGEGA